MVGRKTRRLVAFIVAAVLSLGLTAMTAGAATPPSGERHFGQTTVEPVYNDMTGTLSYISTPDHAQMHANPRAWAPIYLPVYPVGSAAAAAGLLCTDVPTENCPDHGPEIAAAAMGAVPSVYGNGVAGHDHLLAPPASGGDFNIAWEPVVVFFTNPTAAMNDHLTTLAALDAAVAAHDAFEVPLPSLTFLCAVVPAVVYWHGTPVP